MTETERKHPQSCKDQLSTKPEAEDHSPLHRKRHTVRSLKRVNFTRVSELPVAIERPLIAGIWPQNSLVGVIGPSGSGKTFAVLDISCHVGAGRKYLGRTTEKGVVYYLAGEGQAGIRRRVVAWAMHHKVALEDIDLYVADYLPRLVDDEGSNAVNKGILDTIAEIQSHTATVPTIVVIDTVARAMTGADENSASDMGAFVGVMDDIRVRWHATVVSVHHTGHGASDRGRGSSALRASLDVEMRITPKGSKIAMQSTKSKDCAPFADMHFEKRVIDVNVEGPDGDSVTESSLVLIPVAVEETAEGEADLVHMVKRVHATGDTSGRKIHARLQKEGFKVSRAKVDAALKKARLNLGAS